MVKFEWLTPISSEFSSRILTLPNHDSVVERVRDLFGRGTNISPGYIGGEHNKVVIMDNNGEIIASAHNCAFSYIRDGQNDDSDEFLFASIRCRGFKDDENLLILGPLLYETNGSTASFTLTDVNINKQREIKMAAPNNTIVNAPTLNVASLQNMLFRPVQDVVFDMMSGSIGVRTENGIATLSSIKSGSGAATKVEYSVEQNPLDMSMAMPAFAMRIAPEAVKSGDIMYINSKPVFVTEVKGKKVHFVSAEGVEGVSNAPINKLLGSAGVMVCKNFFEGLTGVAATDNPFAAMMPIMMMQMMSGQQTGGNDMFQQVMMMQMMQGMFGGKK